MKRIAYLVSDLHAPSHTFVRREIEALRKRGANIDAFSIRNSDKDDTLDHTVIGHSPFAYVLAIVATLLTNPLRLFGTWWLALAHRPAGLRDLLWSQFHFIEAVFLARKLKQAKIDHLHNHFANSGASVGLLAAHLTGIPWSLTLHGISETDHPAGATLPDKLARARFVACASRFMMAQGMRRLDPDKWDKFKLVRCGVDTARLHELATHKISPAVRLLCVGRLSAEKGYFGLVEALSDERFANTDYGLRIVGDGPQGDQIQQAVTAAGLSDRVEFLGALPENETLREIAGCDVLVLPSLMEGLPVVLIEALALGKPVIASGVAGIPEIVRDGKNGYLIEPGNWDQLADRIHLLLTDRGRLSEMTTCARDSFDTDFDIDRAIEPLVTLFGKPR
ncbi:glycosyltransferase [Qipengyuania vesicularis]|uniref:glycosyltransferase n=1 Tax=Qipengyuania vesicularis TaxID=2867232 RepID=UPI001C885485|nr:glycosyltransferase [Qipengyuania vesicularis]MBX7527888.1 glycosyltransferase [Qipengyuania vesicularis]